MIQAPAQASIPIFGKPRASGDDPSQMLQDLEED